MENYYSVYGLVDCEFCKKAINLLDEKKIPFIFVVLDKNLQFLQKMKSDLNHSTVPIILEHRQDGQFFVGGFQELENILQTHGVSHD